jgi:hypothetical protein
VAASRLPWHIIPVLRFFVALVITPDEHREFVTAVVLTVST